MVFPKKDPASAGSSLFLPMHQSFLEYVLKDMEANGFQIESCTYVLPSKRSGYFLKQHIANATDKNIFAPQIISIEDFLQDIATLNKASSLDLLLELYEAYKATCTMEPDGFDSFLNWSQMLLQDFNEIDRYLVPSKDILNYLSAIKELDHWSLQKQKTELVQNYLELWNSLEKLYDIFKTQLLAKGKGYQGLIYRTAAKNIGDYCDNKVNAPIVFIGFNALSTAEANIVQHLLENTVCEVYWDIDSYFLNDPLHDAGLFIRKYLKEWPHYKSNEPKGIHTAFLTSKKITVTGVPKRISQAKWVGKLLQEVALGKTMEKTAIVLADESLLAPMLKAVPEQVGQVNITMGLPLAETVLYSFVNCYLDVTDSKNERGWFYKTVLKMLSNPYCQKIASSQKTDFVAKVTRAIKANNLLYLKKEHVLNHFESENLYEVFFPSKPISALDCIANCLFLVNQLKDIYQKEKNAVELEYLYRFFTVFNQLLRHIDSFSFQVTVKTLKRLLGELANVETVDFLGEPLTGLQIMGMLESRNLDFDTVLLTSINEGILPSGKGGGSFIPHDVKKQYGLPTYKEKDAIYAYHFHRLIKRAKTVHIVYNTEPNVLGGGEKSRLISQLLTDENMAEFVSHKIASPTIRLSPKLSPPLTKTPLLLQKIKELAIDGFSPTSLTNYIKNPMEFYQKNVLNLLEIEKVEEGIAANTFGNIVHDSLHTLYLPFLGKWLSLDGVLGLKPKIGPVVRSFFEKHLPGVDFSTGRFLLVFRVIEKYLQNFIDMELQQLSVHKIKIMHLEENFEADIHIPELDFPIRLRGILDRIDEFDGVVRIVDYKTGAAEARNVRFKNWEELFSDHGKSKAFQLLCYALLYAHSNKGHRDIKAGIYAIKTLNDGFLQLVHNKAYLVKDELLNEFEERLKHLLLEICDSHLPFVDNEG